MQAVQYRVLSDTLPEEKSGVAIAYVRRWLYVFAASNRGRYQFMKLYLRECRRIATSLVYFLFIAVLVSVGGESFGV